MGKICIESNNSFILKKKGIEHYIELKKQYKEEEFLVFILQRSDKIFWNKNTYNEKSNNILSYFSFVQKEIRNNWDLLKENFDSDASPIFLTFESSQTLMTKLVEFFREKNKLKGINYSSQEIAQKMLSNLYSLSTGNISYNNFSNLIQKQDFLPKLHEKDYEELQNLLELYLGRTLKQAVFDYPSCLYIYNNYLLENEDYLEKIKKYKYILVDDYQSQIPCINIFLSKFSKFSLYKNKFGAYGVHFPNFFKDEEVLNLDKVIKLESPDKDLEGIYSNLFYNKTLALNSKKIGINREFEEKKDLHDYIFKLIETAKDKGINNISVISPSRNIILLEKLESFSRKKQINFLNFDKNERILDNPYIYALCSLSIIYFDYGKFYLNHDEIRQILIIFFKIDIFEATELSRKIKIDKAFIENISKHYKDIPEFFKELFQKNYKYAHEFYEELINNKEFFDEKLVEALYKLYDFSKNFIENIKEFKNIKDKNKELFYTLRNGVKESETLFELNNKINFQGLSLGTPASFLKLNKQSDIIIVIDIGSKLWNLNFVNFMQNPFILNGSVKIDYDWEKNNFHKREELYNLLSGLVQGANKKIYFLDLKSSKNSILNLALSK